jgi:hypothetical protein
MSDVDDKILQIVTNIQKTLTDEQKKQDKLWDDVNDVVGTLANFIQVAGWVVPALSTLVGVFKTFGLLNTDANVSIVAQLQSEFDRLLSEFHGDLEMLQISGVIARAQTGLDNVKDAADPNLPPGVFTPGDDFNRVTDAKNLLTSREFWTRPSTSATVFAITGWFSATPPPDPILPPRVFDPSLSLPALLTAIQIYSATTTALASDGPLPQAWKDRLNELAISLDSFRKEIRDGIVGLRVPTLSEVHLGPLLTSSIFVSVGGASFGAAFLYSTRRVVDEFPLDPLKGISPEDYPLFLARFKLGTIARKKALYILLNLHETWETVQHLRTLAQVTPDFRDPSYGWSASEIAKALEESFPPDPNTLRLGVSLRRDVMAHLRTVVIPNVEDDLGLRALLTRVTP